MSTLGPFGVPTGSAGILHPKLVNKFVVRFNCVYGGSDIREAEEHLRVLSMQVISVDEFPKETYGAPLKVKRAKPPMQDINADGQLVITFQDDAMSRLTAALDFLVGPNASHIKIVVAKLDGNEGITEAHVYGQVQLKTLAHSTLNYSGTQGGFGSLSGRMTDKSPDHIDVNASISMGTGTVTKTLTVLPTWAMRGAGIKDMNSILAI